MPQKNPNASFFLSRDKAKGYLRNLLKATRGKLARESEGEGRPQAALVKDFFRKNRATPDNVDLADHSTGHLDQMTSYLLGRDFEQFQTVVDVGCGNGAMRYKVRPKRYIGIDLHISNEDEGNEFFLESPISDADISNIKISAASFYMINCLCYCERIDDLGDFVATNIASGDVLNVIEPINAFWWETDFGGIRVYVRSPEQITQYLSAKGLILEESAFCHIDRLLPFSPFRVFQAHRFRRQ